MATPRPKTLLIFSQTFVPDPASVGQHMSDVAFEMARRGHPVLVYRFIVKHSSLVVALDRFMAGRLRERGVSDSKMLVMPPWPHENHMEVVAPDENSFRKCHQLDGKFVIMYSGNHSPANPLKT